MVGALTDHSIDESAGVVMGGGVGGVGGVVEGLGSAKRERTSGWLLWWRETYVAVEVASAGRRLECGAMILFHGGMS